MKCFSSTFFFLFIRDEGVSNVFMRAKWVKGFTGHPVPHLWFLILESCEGTLAILLVKERLLRLSPLFVS